jgi:RimJ/RimL family protein N-acetyltransferase
MSSVPKPQPVTLEGKVVRLEPLRPGHAPLLWDAAGGSVDNLFRWIPFSMRTAADFEKSVSSILREQDAGTSIPFATVERASGKVIGATRFMNMDLSNRRVEIGSTWVATAFHRTAVNTEAKYLMLCHAFGPWQCLRVELKTDALNQRSRDAILRLGAKQEGIFRQHMITWDGRRRDSVYFSILDSEWPEIKARLEEKLRWRAEQAGR